MALRYLHDNLQTGFVWDGAAALLVRSAVGATDGGAAAKDPAH